MAKQKKTVSGNFISDVRAELKKVTWPTRQQTIKLTLVVLLISLIIGLYLGIIDVLLTHILEGITSY